VEQKKGDLEPLGGLSITLHIEPHLDDMGEPMPVTPAQVDQAMQVIKKRLKSTSTADFTIARQDDNGMLLQVPAAKPEQAARIRAALEPVGRLELRQVCPRNEEVGADDKSLAKRVAENLEIVPGYKVFNYTHKDADGNEATEPILLNRRVAVGGSDIARAFPSLPQPDAVEITLNKAGTEKMIALTKPMRPGLDRIAIVLDGKVVSAPTVRQVPLGKNFIIEGLNQPGEVQTLANALMNPLEVQLKIDDVRTLSPKAK
jgi:SecD/SecF fusion protein